MPSGGTAVPRNPRVRNPCCRWTEALMLESLTLTLTVTLTLP